MSAETVQQEPVAVLASRLEELRNELTTRALDVGIPDPGAASLPALVRDLEELAGITPDVIDVPAGVRSVSCNLHGAPLSLYESYRQWTGAKETVLEGGTVMIGWRQGIVEYAMFRPDPGARTGRRDAVEQAAYNEVSTHVVMPTAAERLAAREHAAEGTEV